MRLFAIADASKRKARPIGILLWEPDESEEQGRFLLELSCRCDAQQSPLSLSFCAQRADRRATPEESLRWAESRIVPRDRQNIVEVLKANGLSSYDVVSLLALSQGRSSHDDYLVYELDVSPQLARVLVTRSAMGTALDADWVIDHFGRHREEGKIAYAFIRLDSEDDALGEAVPATQASGSRSTPSAARRIGETIRARRHEAGYTQKQLAARAGITQTVLSRVESGKGNPTLELLEDLAAALGTELDVGLR